MIAPTAAQTSQLAVQKLRPAASKVYALEDILKIAHHFAASGYFPDARQASQAYVKILAGQEYGIGPMQAMAQIYVIKEKITLSALLIGAIIKRSMRYDYRILEHNTTTCRIEFFQMKESLGVSEFTMEDAKTAGLTSNDTYKKYPRNMLFSRAMSNGARWHTPDVFGGAVYTPDEMGAEIEYEGPDGAGNMKVVTPDVALNPPAPMVDENAVTMDDVVKEAESQGIFPPDGFREFAFAVCQLTLEEFDKRRTRAFTQAEKTTVYKALLKRKADEQIAANLAADTKAINEAAASVAAPDAQSDPFAAAEAAGVELAPERITDDQRMRLQASCNAEFGRQRAKRLEWASSVLGRPIATFNDLSKDEAHKLIDTLEGPPPEGQTSLLP
jgi:hypothetical protein